jgi:two-component system phosphate regulon sensor histidine kinase PhoR
MNKVVLNLVSNAIRYTPEKGSVTVRAFKSSARYGFTVKDTGIGIPPEDRDKVFQEFYRSKEAKKMEKIGTGMGLSMVKEIVEKNGGEIILESEVGKGSTFIVKFPLPRELQWRADV